MPASRLSEGQKAEMVERFRQGEATVDLANAYECSPNTVSRVVKAALDGAEYERLKRQRQRRQGGAEAEGFSRDDIEEPSSEAAAAVPEDGALPDTAALEPDPIEASSEEQAELPSLGAVQAQGELWSGSQPREPEASIPERPSASQTAPPDVGMTAANDDLPSISSPGRADGTEPEAVVLAIEDAEDFGDDDEDDNDDNDDEELVDDGEFLPIPVSDLRVEGALADVQVWGSGSLPSSAYMLVEKTVELQPQLLRELPELGLLPDEEQERQALVLYVNPRQAKRQCGRHQRVIRIPDIQVFELTAPKLVAQGITRLVVEGSLYALPGC